MTEFMKQVFPIFGSPSFFKSNGSEIPKLLLYDDKERALTSS